MPPVSPYRSRSPCVHSARCDRPILPADRPVPAPSHGSAPTPAALIDFILFQAQRERFLIPHITVGLLETARKVQRKYAGLDLDLADAVNVALAAEYRTHSVLAGLGLSM